MVGYPSDSLASCVWNEYLFGLESTIFSQMSHK